MITSQDLQNAVIRFDQQEKRANFFKMATNLKDKGFEIEGIVLLLSTWNFGSFRYAVKTFDTDKFKSTINNLNPLFDKLKTENFRTINFNIYQEDIQTIYDTLSQIQGIEYTGASKVMHLKNPHVFVMWDAYIRGEATKYIYQQLPIYQDKKIEFKKYGTTSDGYLSFLKDMQARFNDIGYKDIEGKTLAKVIDEFNYVEITMRMQEIEKENEEAKKNLIH